MYLADGGSSPPPDAWGWWTGFAECCGVNNGHMRRFVKNWNDQWDKPNTDLLYR